MQIMDALNSVMAPLSALTNGKVFLEAMHLAFPFKPQASDGANRRELRTSM
jgi:hypothetical protein